MDGGDTDTNSLITGQSHDSMSQLTVQILQEPGPDHAYFPVQHLKQSIVEIYVHIHMFKFNQKKA